MIRLLFACLALGSTGLVAEEGKPATVISVVEAAQQVGQEVTVKGRVEGQRTSKSGHTYINFGGKYPNHVFSCFLSAKNFTEPVPSFAGKEIEVTGVITMYESKPQMEVTSLSQIRVLEESPAGTPAPKQSEPAS